MTEHSTDLDITPVIRLTGVSKRYGGTFAVQGVDFDVRPGEIHALLGENGAGKSTMVKIISGAITQDAGTLEVEGAERRFAAPRDSTEAGVAMVYQEGSLVESMTVAQNLFLGDERAFNDFGTLNVVARELLESHNFHIRPDAEAGALGIGQKQMVEIARAVHRNAKVVILDEPTASVTPEERLQLFMSMQSLRRRGIGVVFITHMLDEAFEQADRITVLRDGVVQGTLNRSEFGHDRVVKMMVGRTVEMGRKSSSRRPDIFPSLQVEDLTLLPAVRSMSFSAYGGEILGLYGLVGAGRSEVAQIISGVVKRRHMRGGTVWLGGERVRFRTPRHARKAGIVYITEDRKASGFFGHLTISENIFLGYLCSALRLPLWFRPRLGRAIAKKFVEQFEVRTLAPNKAVVEELSGGNQQKVVLAKGLTRKPRVAIIDEPTRGVDLGTIPEIHAMIRALADEGVAVIVISSYIPEIQALSDRVLVARGGSIAAEFSPDEADEESLMFAAAH
ncbi:MULTISPECIES: sugar ABC transporter ATP-binding protein [Rhodococcus]|uniref:Sugar ABC transporter ATP-binding protein n=1 Tax=Rhodococcus oxybenzonivorans TaxID=1990687 RepID=A0AAE5A9R0_9NOCA|nr:MULTISPECIES: sugar ABC transporter ATP-binding protein [Rhodococcus]MDV7242652.1 sugar ABC transporter ATP-binding protein [Rhodococcus oxybenzonivorans]MDV7268791.1 sugar ABC transporter ATP-binding protein [Rhodococcus oxybenzonivorans]MDV7276085.1 sugar ABC transporter ATP-binding protein [Rhodococcus oxybenzonivorans]MDV7332140.1 sugar ABC transporter ATP-binding protein [Rhodococcus oxybenzonivorans]MDV7344345.1 sugar ABC transporter ATP-binding protein [Rhodococcus oxybenzonivorans]